MSRKAWCWFAAVWTICLIIASLQPVRPAVTAPHHSPAHQAQHLIIFGATALLYRTIMRSRLAFCWVVALALFIETAQLLMYHTPDGFEWWDVRDDTIAAAVVLVAAHYFQSAVKTLNS